MNREHETNEVGQSKSTVREDEKLNWLNTIYNDNENGITNCPFVEYSTTGHEKRCYLKPSPEICKLCILGSISDILCSLNEIERKIPEGADER